MMRTLSFHEEELQGKLQRRNSLTGHLLRAGTKGDHEAIESLLRSLRINRASIKGTVELAKRDRTFLASAGMKNAGRRFF